MFLIGIENTKLTAACTHKHALTQNDGLCDRSDPSVTTVNLRLNHKVIT